MSVFDYGREADDLDLAGDVAKPCVRCGLPVFDIHATFIDGDRYCEDPCAPAHLAELDEEEDPDETTDEADG